MQLKNIKGVGDKTLFKLKKLGIENIDDLVRFMPKFYWDMTKESNLKECDHGDYVLLRGEVVKKTKPVNIRRSLSIVKADFVTQGQKIKLTWFNTPYVTGQIELNTEYLFWGKISLKDGIVLTNPAFEKAEGSKRLQGVVPIYPLRGHVGQQQFRNWMEEALKADIQSPADKYANITFKEALYHVHFPTSMDDMRFGKTRINLENLIMQYIAYRVNKNVVSEKKLRLYGQNGSILAPTIKNLPYALTQSQEKALNEIIADLKGPFRTNRMLLGDVGSGKTVVALLSSLFAIKNGYQVAIMVPTEILARQHYMNAQKLLKDENINIAILTSSTKAQERKLILEKLRCGVIDLVVGTHAVLNDKVEFRNLSFIIIDELHKFGVKQKGTLEEKARQCDVLSMSATPIPRAIALTMYGDLAISNLKPREGTAKVTTHIMGDDKLPGMYKFIEERVKAGEQAYIVCPLVLDSEGLEVYSAKHLYKEVINKQLKDVKVGLIYGSMKDKEKNEMMQAFYNKEIDVLIATSVIEVGIDSQYASIMTVLNADRFGLATLHQLRGRIGRKAGLRSYCFLHTSKDMENERLQALVNNKDGDAIAEYDASVRGYGDFLGERQSGSSFKGDAIITKQVIQECKRISDLLLQDKNFDMSQFVNIDVYLEKLQNISLN